MLEFFIITKLITEELKVTTIKLWDATKLIISKDRLSSGW